MGRSYLKKIIQVTFHLVWELAIVLVKRWQKLMCTLLQQRSYLSTSYFLIRLIPHLISKKHFVLLFGILPDILMPFSNEDRTDKYHVRRPSGVTSENWNSKQFRSYFRTKIERFWFISVEMLFFYLTLPNFVFRVLPVHVPVYSSATPASFHYFPFILSVKYWFLRFIEDCIRL